jgi:plastocyanin
VYPINHRHSRTTSLLAFMLALGALSFGGGCSNSRSPTKATDASGTIRINASGVSFSPASVQIQVGDTVKWVEVSGTHTTTSGTGAADPNAGVLWDEPLGSGQTYARVFTSAGTFPYFCRLHESMGMKGTITVTGVQN